MIHTESNIVQPVPPFLSIPHLKLAKQEVWRSNPGSYHWVVFNTNDRVLQRESEQIYLRTFKAIKQIENIIDTCTVIKKTLEDFIAGNFDEYIDRHNSFADEQTPPFDPYKTFWTFLDIESVTDLPRKIEQYAELVEIISQVQKRSQAHTELFNNLFKGVDKAYLSIDEDGTQAIIPDKDIPDGVLANIQQGDINKDMRYIQIEHCLDNYNVWYKLLTIMIKGREPFDQIIKLIR